LAFYSGTEDYPKGCQRAEELFRQLMSDFGEDPIVAGIVAENRAICARAGELPASSTPTPTPSQPTRTP
jgi:hypothetical protein